MKSEETAVEEHDDEDTRAKLSPMQRWLVVIEAFLDHDDWGVRDLAQRTGLPRSACHRILHEMQRSGLLTTGSETGRFRVGPALVRVCTVLSRRLDITGIARPILEQTRDEGGETVVLGLYDPNRRAFFAAVASEANHAIRYDWRVLEAWNELYLGASGKAILAFLDDEERDAILADLPARLPGRHNLTKAALKKDLVETRARGYAISHGDRFESTVGVAAPARDATGQVIGDVIITWPASRYDSDAERRLGELARRAAERLSGELGYHPA
jgi:DNA-binding IclR family transcriptional regulator